MLLRSHVRKAKKKSYVFMPRRRLTYSCCYGKRQIFIQQTRKSPRSAAASEDGNSDNRLGNNNNNSDKRKNNPSTFQSSSPILDSEGGRHDYDARKNIFPADLSRIEAPGGKSRNYWLNSPGSPILRTSYDRHNLVAMRSKRLSDKDPIITLDDEEDALAGEQDGRRRSARSRRDHDIFVTYKTATVSVYDYRTLEREEYVNDAIIDFYLQWLHEETLSKDAKNEVHIFSSHFYSKLTSKGRGRMTAAAIADDVPKSKAARAYEHVKNWTKKVDLFSKTMVVVPICEESHWYVIIICNVGSIDLDEETTKIKGQPYFLVLDSLGELHPDAVQNLRDYLRQEFQAKRKTVVLFDETRMAVKTPEVPQQNNSCDCGMYLLHYVELVFKNPMFFRFHNKLEHEKMSDWFCDGEVQHKRENIADLIQKIGKDVEFPQLRFVERKNRRKRKAAAKVEEELEEEKEQEDQKEEEHKDQKEEEELPDLTPTPAPNGTRVDDGAESKQDDGDQEKEKKLAADAKAALKKVREQSNKLPKDLSPQEATKAILAGSGKFQDLQDEMEEEKKKNLEEQRSKLNGQLARLKAKNEAEMLSLKQALYTSPEEVKSKTRTKKKMTRIPVSLDVEIVRSEDKREEEKPKEELEEGEIEDEEPGRRDKEKRRKRRSRSRSPSSSPSKNPKRKKGKKSKKRNVKRKEVSSSDEDAPIVPERRSGRGRRKKEKEADITIESDMDEEVSFVEEEPKKRVSSREDEDSGFVMGGRSSLSGRRHSSRNYRYPEEVEEDSFDRTNPLLANDEKTRKFMRMAGMTPPPLPTRTSTTAPAPPPPPPPLPEPTRLPGGNRVVKLVRTNLDPEWVEHRPEEAVRESERRRENSAMGECDDDEEELELS